MFLRRKRERRQGVAGQGTFQHSAPASTLIEGRRYYEQAPYALPKDERDVHRLDFQHYLLRCVMKGNYLAPLATDQLHNVLDVGCGTGRWGLEMAQAFPKAQIIGVDLERLETSNMPLPNNYHFQQANILQGLPFAEQTFDYVHQRLLVMGIPLAHWVQEISELMRVTRVGGWIELIESGTTFLPAGELTQRWCSWGMQISQARGLDPSAIANLAQFARQAGMQEIVSNTFEIPVGNWGGALHGEQGRMGLMQLQNLRALFEGGIPLLKRELHLAEQVLQGMLPQLEEEWTRLRTQLRYVVVIGRKADARTSRQTTGGR